MGNETQMTEPSNLSSEQIATRFAPVTRADIAALAAEEGVTEVSLITKLQGIAAMIEDESISEWLLDELCRVKNELLFGV